MSRDPALTPQAFVCDKCKHEWTGKLLNNVIVDLWVAYAKSLHCPKCGAGWKRLAFRDQSPMPPGEIDIGAK